MWAGELEIKLDEEKSHTEEADRPSLNLQLILNFEIFFFCV